MKTAVKSLVAMAALLWVATIWAVNPDPESDYYKLIGQADEAIDSKTWAEAEECLLGAIALEPENPLNVMLLSNLGIVQYNLGRDSLAITALNRAHEIAPKSYTILGNRAQVLTAMGRIEAALADYALMSELDSTAVEPVYLHSLLSLKADDFDGALADCKKLQHVAPTDDMTNLAFASYYTASEKWANAVPYYTEILNHTPSADMYAARAVCYLMLNRLSEASDDIGRGLELDPDNRELYFYRAHLNKLRYQKEDARSDLLRALQGKQPDDK